MQQYEDQRMKDYLQKMIAFGTILNIDVRDQCDGLRDGKITELRLRILEPYRHPAEREFESWQQRQKEYGYSEPTIKHIKVGLSFNSASLGATYNPPLKKNIVTKKNPIKKGK